ncbi:MAG: ATP-binding protein [Chitinophagaceae bacterium]
MKKFLLITVFLIQTIVSTAQRRNVDSLKQLLRVEKTDTGRVRLYAAIQSHYNYSDADSALLYAKYALQAVQRLKIPLLEAEYYASLSYSYYLFGNFVAAMQAALTGLSLAENEGSKPIEVPAKYRKFLFRNDSIISVQNIRQNVIARNHYMMGFVYMATEQPQKATEQLLISKHIFQSTNNKSRLYFTMSRLTEALAQSHRYKEGLKCGLEAYKLTDSLKTVGKTVAEYYIGNNYLGLKDTLTAKQWYYKALASAKEEFTDRGIANAGLAQIFLATNKTDSALWHAHRALYQAQTQKLKRFELTADTLLAAIHAANGNKDSAYFYLQTSLKLRNEILNTGKAQELLTLVNAEKQHKADRESAQATYKRKLQLYIVTGVSLLLLIGALLLWRNNRQRLKAHKKLFQQKEELEETLQKLNATQAQLIQSEKMASLGELTAGIAHEIQNPLNFVNNFSEVNKELLIEMNAEIKKGNTDEVVAIAKDIIDNEQKINHHGKRADAIVKGMLQHSRSSSGIKEPTDINKLADEYLRLAYHGLRAKDKSFNVTLKTNYDESISNINIIPQEIGRVILNLITNAFYAVTEKKKQQQDNYEPTVSVSTKKLNDTVEVRVSDNGNGIPQKVLDKIFQPFFTTKPTGQGTGLGLSLSYDIVKAHGGEIIVETKGGEGTAFIIHLPIAE